MNEKEQIPPMFRLKLTEENQEICFSRLNNGDIAIKLKETLDGIEITGIDIIINNETWGEIIATMGDTITEESHKIASQ